MSMTRFSQDQAAISTRLRTPSLPWIRVMWVWPGALLPAVWAARTRPATALRAEWFWHGPAAY